MSDTIAVKVEDIKVGDLVDLESCPYLHDHASAICEYAEVTEVKRETADCLAICYEGIDQVGYRIGTKLKVVPRKCVKCGKPVSHTQKTPDQPEEAEYDEDGNAYCQECWDWENDAPPK